MSTKRVRNARQQSKSGSHPVLLARLNTADAGKSRQRGRPRTVVDGGSNRRNDYLATLLDPENVKGVGIPDFDTYPSSRIQTSKRIRVTSDAAGNWTAAIKPCLHRGILYPGIDGATGNYHSVAQRLGGAAAPAGTTFATAESPVTDNDRAYLCANYASIRPVSMVVKTEPIAAALTMAGDLLVTTCPAEEQLFPASYSTLAATGIENSSIAQQPCYVGPADVMSGKGQLESLSREVAVTWKPEGPTSYQYATVSSDPSSSAVVEQGSVGFFGNRWWVPGTATTPASYDIFYLLQLSVNAGAGAGIQNAAAASVSNAMYLLQVEPNIYQPSILLKIEGAPVSTAVIELEIIINWEAIPRNAVSALMPTSFSPHIPDELAQATNVLAQIPPAYYPGTPSMPANEIRDIAMQSATHLYDGKTHRRDAVTGASLFTRFRRGVGSLLSKASGALLGIPKAGPLLSGGAALLGSLLQR
jgi:hypothetical protein